MGTPTFLQFALNGHKMGELKRVCAAAVATAEDIGAADIKGTAVASVKRMMGNGGQKPPRDSLIEHEVMCAMAGMDLPMDFIETPGEDEDDDADELDKLEIDLNCTEPETDDDGEDTGVEPETE